MRNRKWDFHMNFAFSEFSHFSICFPGYLRNVCVSFLLLKSSCFLLICGTCVDSDHWSSAVFSWFIIYFLICLVCILIYRYIIFVKILWTFISSLWITHHAFGSDPTHLSVPRICPPPLQPLPPNKAKLKRKTKKPKQTNKTKTTTNKTKQRSISLWKL